jgi:hypothetical protein
VERPLPAAMSPVPYAPIKNTCWIDHGREEKSLNKL